MSFYEENTTVSIRLKGKNTNRIVHLNRKDEELTLKANRQLLIHVEELVELNQILNKGAPSPDYLKDFFLLSKSQESTDNTHRTNARYVFLHRFVLADDETHVVGTISTCIADDNGVKRIIDSYVEITEDIPADTISCVLDVIEKIENQIYEA